MPRLLSLYIRLNSDAESQKLALFVKNGFRLESWNALDLAGNVYDARILALEHPDQPAGMNPPLYSIVGLTTVYDGNALPYQQLFWSKLCVFFQLVAFAAKEAPYTLADFTPEQVSAFKAAKLAIEACRKAETDIAGKTEVEIAAAIETAQTEFSRTNDALVSEMDKDVTRKKNGEIAKTKFELFIDFVNRNDLTYGVGTPNEAGFPAKDPRQPPNREAGHYFNPRIQPIAQ